MAASPWWLRAVILSLWILVGAQDQSPESAALRKDFPDDPTKWFERVNVAFKAKDKAAAAALLHDASKHFPNQPDLAFNHGYVLFDMGDHAASIAVLERLCGLDVLPLAARRKKRRAEGAGGRRMEPKWVDVLVKAYVKQGRVADAVALADVQLAAMDREQDPLVHARVALNVYPWRLGSAAWDKIKAHFKELKQAVRLSLSLNASEVERASLRMSPHNSLIFLSTELSAGVISRYVAQTHAVNGTRPQPRPCKKRPCPFTIGYLLWEVVETDVLYTLVAGLLQEHSAATAGGAHVVVYILTRRLPPDHLNFTHVDRGGRVRFMSFSQTDGWRAARIIREDGVHVLFDLTTYGDFTGAHVLRHVPAPVQVGFLGYPGPKVAEFIDASLWDALTVPPELSRWGGERVAYVPGASMPSSLTRLYGRAPVFGGQTCAGAGAEVRAELGVPPQATLLCNFLQTWKIDPTVFGAWMEVLGGAMDEAYLLLWAQSKDTEVNLGKEARKRNASTATRVRFVEKVEGHEGFHRRLCACDLFLDTPFYNAGSTTVSVLWTGTPLLTLPGNRTAARLAAGHVMGGGGGALTVARDLEEYKALMKILGERGGRGWRAARASIEACRGGSGSPPCSMFDAGRQMRTMTRASEALRRLEDAVPRGVSRFHLILAQND